MRATRAGTPAAATTQRRKRSVLYNAVGYAVEQRLLNANPIDRIQWKAPEVAETLDRRVAASPAPTRALLAAVRAHGSRGQHLGALFGCLYYAALRRSPGIPAERLALFPRPLKNPDGSTPIGPWNRTPARSVIQACSCADASPPTPQTWQQGYSGQSDSNTPNRHTCLKFLRLRVRCPSVWQDLAIEIPMYLAANLGWDLDEKGHCR